MFMFIEADIYYQERHLLPNESRSRTVQYSNGESLGYAPELCLFSIGTYQIVYEPLGGEGGKVLLVWDIGLYLWKKGPPDNSGLGGHVTSVSCDNSSPLRTTRDWTNSKRSPGSSASSVTESRAGEVGAQSASLRKGPPSSGQRLPAAGA
ncbi:hypothetical protein ISCGN_031710 [Ixodes scapularis]